MAESAVAFLLEKLGNLVIQEVSIFGQVELPVRLLCNELEWMHLFLREAGATRPYNNRLRLWMNQIRDAAYDAEDAIDEFMFKVEHHRQRPLDNIKLLKLLPTWVNFSNKLPLVHELDARIREINFKIEKILANKWRYGVENPVLASDVWNNAYTVDAWRERTVWRIVQEEDVVGMRHEVRAVKRMLIGGERRREVVAIVGMGGLGKTTLAKKVYNDDNVKDHFDCHAWIYVSQKHRIRELLLEVIHLVMPLVDAERSRISMMAEEKLGKKLSNYLKGYKYLIVLDDIWSFEIWRVLSSYFPESHKSSRVLITTRNREIALHANAWILEPHRLNQQESWKLFLRKSFQVRRTRGVCPEELENLGRRIAAGCRGLPLAIVVLGGLLSRKEKTKSSWERVLEGMEWHLDHGPESFLTILALSYNDLPYYLKSCFLYCAIFLKDHEIKVRKIINFWVAEGFIPKRGREIMEDIAQDYLDELIRRSMIRVARRKPDGAVKSFYIHHLLQELAISEAQDSNFFEVYESINLTSPTSIRRLTVHQHHNISHHLRISRLRSFICFSTYIEQKTLTSLLVLKSLTVLDLPRQNEEDHITTLPEEIGDLVLLKYLCLQGWRLRSLPLSIGRLVNLQTLDLQHSEIKSTPSTIWKLHQLRHLYGSPNMIVTESMTHRCLADSHSGVNKLTDLQTLYLRSGSWLQNERLQKLIQLRKLKLYGWFNNLSELYPPNLMKLELKNTWLSEDPMVILGRLPNLRVLKLMSFSYVGKKLVLPSGGFHKLEQLKLEWLNPLEKLKVRKGAMPALHILQINKCCKLKNLPDGLPRLKIVLRRLELNNMARELIDDFRTKEGEGWDVIRSISLIDQGLVH